MELQNNPDLRGRLDEILMPSLEVLDLSLTMVSGTFPQQTISNLIVLKLWGAEVTGTLPTEIGTWTSLGTVNEFCHLWLSTKIHKPRPIILNLFFLSRLAWPRKTQHA